MIAPGVGGHKDVPPHTAHRVVPFNSGVCECGAVFDYGNVVVPAEFAGMCGRCAFKRGLQLGTSVPLSAPRGGPMATSLA